MPGITAVGIYKIGEDSTSETIKEINKTLQGKKGADRKEMKKREEYENEPLEQHNRKFSLGRSPKVDHETER